MTRLLLDTTFLVDAERTRRNLDQVVGDDDDVAIAAITVAELRVGALLADGGHRQAREAFLAEVQDAIPVIDYGLDVAEAHAALLVEVRGQGAPRGAHDLIIAATAVQSGRVIVTADARRFAALAGVETRTYR